MKLSTAAVIIAAGTSNVFSPNVVLAGKAGKLAPKASKAKTAKAHPSLSYGSGSYSMSIGPPPPCPCWSQSELNEVTGDNVIQPGETSCVVFEGGNTNTLTLFYQPENQDPLQSFIVAPYDGDGLGSYGCVNGDEPALEISEAEYDSCFQQIEDQCADIGYPVTSADCPCFDEQDLLAVTAENADDPESTCNFSLSSGEEKGTVTFSVSVSAEEGERYCSKVNGGGGGAIADLGISIAQRNACLVLLSARCDAVLAPDN